MTSGELQQLIQHGEGYNLEFKQSIPSKASDLAKEFKYSEHFDSVAFKEFLQKANITDSIGEKRVLDNLRLTIASGKFTYAAVMMFAKDVQHYVDHATIRCVLFKGIDKRYILDSKEMNGNIVHQFEEALKYIISKLNLRYEIEGQSNGRRKENLDTKVFQEILCYLV